MIDDLEDLIVQSIAQGKEKEALRLMKKLKEENSSTEEFSNCLARLFFEEMWHQNDAREVWDKIVSTYRHDLQQWDVQEMVRHAVSSDQFYMVYSFLNNDINVDFSDHDTLFGCMMCAPLEICQNLDSYWDEGKIYSVLPMAAIFNSDDRVLEYVLKRLNANNVLEEIEQSRKDNTLTWGDNVVIHISDEVLDDIVEAINHAQADRIEQNVGKSQSFSLPPRKI